MKKKLLLSACEDLIKSFNPKKMTLDSHADEQLGDADSPNADPNCVFIKQVFYGCVRHKEALKVHRGDRRLPPPPPQDPARRGRPNAASTPATI